MANEESTKFSSSSANLKVPPLKIVLSSHQNNAVVNIEATNSDDQFKPNNDSEQVVIKDDNGRRSSLDQSEGYDKPLKKNSRSVSERADYEAVIPTANQKAANYASTSSSSSTSSDRSDSTTPSSESESIASNSTIISDNQQVKTKEEPTVTKPERQSKHGVRTASDKSTTNTIVGKKSQDSVSEQASDSSTTMTINASNTTTITTTITTTPNPKEQVLSANQRITRSSQRAAQQIKIDNPGESNNDDNNVLENNDKVHEPAKKVKRRKGEPQEDPQDSTQNAAQPTVILANIYPADYKLPAQNSFELYRDIRKRPYKKLMKLNSIQPKVPPGFKDYLLNKGPYLLDGNKLGVGFNGSKLKKQPIKNSINNHSLSGRLPLRMTLSNLHHKYSSQLTSQQLNTSYNIPKLLEVPKSLPSGSPLYELFRDQERARQQMRMQHLKERERSILAAEQEILRAYNKSAIADKRQNLHLSACTYFYYQERYHYIDVKSGAQAGNTSSKDVPHSQDNSFLCIEGGEAVKCPGSETQSKTKDDKINNPDESPSASANSRESTKSKDSTNSKAEMEAERPSIENNSETKTSDEMKLNENKVADEDSQQESRYSSNGDSATINSFKANDAIEKSESKQIEESKKTDDQANNIDVDSDNSISESSYGKDDPTKNMSEEDLKVFNKGIFLHQLQEIDEKWDNIKRDMLVRHRNESDSLHAVQTLEWEWKAKEIGACDVRVSLKIEPEFVPRVEVTPLDY